MPVSNCADCDGPPGASGFYPDPREPPQFVDPCLCMTCYRVALQEAIDDKKCEVAQLEKDYASLNQELAARGGVRRFARRNGPTGGGGRS